MALVEPDRFTDLKARVKAECLRRAYSGSVASYGGTLYDYSTTPAAGNTIAQEHRSKLAVPLNAINSNKVPDTSGERVVSSDDIATMEAFTTVLEKRAKTDSSGSDCKSGCTGLCYGCTGTCTGTCSDTCTGTCTNSCTGDCSGGCYYGCSSCGGCDYGCSGCGSGCATSCYAKCNNNCYDTCSVTCGYQGCVGECVSSCVDGCSTGCSQLCGDCGNTCTAVSK